GGVDPLEGRVQGRLATGSSDDRLVDATGVADPSEAVRPSLTTVLVGWKLRCAKVAIAARRKPFTRRNFKRIGLPSGVVSTAATIGVLPGEPRPRLPPLRSPPR